VFFVAAAGAALRSTAVVLFATPAALVHAATAMASV